MRHGRWDGVFVARDQSDIDRRFAVPDGTTTYNYVVVESVTP
ncbi:MAG TPA: hypothetical protein VFD53_01890 [Ilumatobacter sp.]|nr:hypothetical protein [Ilumatobacter sp.]